ncbi:MAG: ATP-binding protein, partial [Candidatus Bipolaricaulia bacterium]
AISGKGGVGKTTLVALLAREAVSRGYRVLAVDADPAANLAATLGIAEEITPLAELRDLIKERAGEAGLIKLNPKVDDIPERYSAYKDGIRVMVLGAIQRGGGGCACPENSFLRGLLRHLLLERDELVLVDMEAGIEHLGRGTAQGVEALIVVVDPDLRSLQTAAKIAKLAHEIGLERVLAVGNKVRDPSERDYIFSGLPKGLPLLGYISYSERLRLAGQEGGLPALLEGPLRLEVEQIFSSLTELIRSISASAAEERPPAR